MGLGGSVCARVVKRYPTVKLIRGVPYRYENIVTADGRRTSRCLGRLEELQPQIDTVTSEGGVTGFLEPVRGQGRPRGRSSPLSGQGSPNAQQEDRSETQLQMGDVVRHRLNSELVGRIVWLDASKAKVELLSWPTEWWRQWGQQPVPVRLENLELIE